jgi:hypothetical protein
VLGELHVVFGRSYRYRYERRYSTLQTVHSSADDLQIDTETSYVHVLLQVSLQVSLQMSLQVSLHASLHTSLAIQSRHYRCRPCVSIDTLTGARSSRCNKDEIKIDDYENLWFQYREGRSSSDALREKEYKSRMCEPKAPDLPTWEVDRTPAHLDDL